MLSTYEYVAEFRDIVDKSIASFKAQYSNAGHGLTRSWLQSDELATVNGLHVASVPLGSGRNSVFGLGREHVWGVSPVESIRTENRSGRIAIISELGDPEILVRRIDFDSAMRGPFMGVVTQRNLESNEIKEAVDWARSPHLYGEFILKASVLKPKEADIVDERLSEISIQAKKLNTDLEAIGRAHRQPLPNIFIG